MEYSFARLPYQLKHNQWSGTRDGLCNFSKTGTGKTVMEVDRVNAIKPNKLLIVCPKSAMAHTWQDAMQDNTGMSGFLCKGTAKNRIRNINCVSMEQGPSYLIINYDVIDKYKEQLMAVGFDMVIYDESHKVSRLTARTKAALKISEPIKHVDCLSGTPSLTDDLGYFHQIALTNEDSEFGTNYYKWRSIWFDKFTIPNTNITSYTVKKDLRDRFMNIIADNSFMVTERECSGLPDKVIRVMSHDMSPKQVKISKALREDYIVEVDGVSITCDSNASLATKLSQIAGGFIYDSDTVAHSICDDKVKVMGECLESMGGEQCIIWYAFRCQRDLICKSLKSKSYTELNEDDRVQYIKDFISGKNRYFIAHPASCGESLTLTNCRHEIWYSLPRNTVHYSQAGARINRLSQKRKVISTILQADGSIDEHILDGLNKNLTADQIISNFLSDRSMRR